MTTSSSISSVTAAAGRSRFFWEEAADDWRAACEAGRRPEFSEYVTRSLRALREGVGREAGTVPAMRSVHRVSLRDDGLDRLPDRYVAEHCTLTLFGLHQHTASEPVHRPGVGLGTACLLLRRGEALTEAAVERRLIAAATAQDLHELVQHLQRLVPLLQQSGVGLDYTRLFRELAVWDGTGRNRVLRAWGLQYTDPGTPVPTEGEADGEAEGRERAPYWVTFEPGSPDAGAELAALRAGTGREPGTVAVMWPFHRTRMASEWRNKGSLTRDLAAEHTALTLFARHQQTHDRRMHVPGSSPGTAVGLLARKAATDSEGKAATAALERRFGHLLTSADAEELAMHLRSFAPLLNRAGVGLDYDLLSTALRTWDDPRRPHAAGRFRQRWDRDFHTTVTASS
ncbi:type I-E CRISPR-associated protein Cse2/CasB [Streptomyces rochei]|uniref:type I-E CRISPR-associated protein Cse2/CasB n=1 Tax=Streptomyces rochei TaxID=1928 RepID=UPI0036360017